MTNQTPQKALAIFGSWEPGDAVLTIGSDSPMYLARRYDRIQALKSTTPFSEVLTPGLNDRMFKAVQSLSRIFWLSPDKSETITGTLPVINQDGSLSWPNGGGPPPDTSYTLEGVRYDELFVYRSLASDRNSGVSGLPIKLAARNFDLIGRS